MTSIPIPGIIRPLSNTQSLSLAQTKPRRIDRDADFFLHLGNQFVVCVLGNMDQIRFMLEHLESNILPFHRYIYVRSAFTDDAAPQSLDFLVYRFQYDTYGSQSDGTHGTLVQYKTASTLHLSIFWRYKIAFLLLLTPPECLKIANVLIRQNIHANS